MVRRAIGRLGLRARFCHIGPGSTREDASGIRRAHNLVCQTLGTDYESLALSPEKYCGEYPVNQS